MAKTTKAEQEKHLAQRRAYAKEYYARRKAAKAAAKGGETSTSTKVHPLGTMYRALAPTPASATPTDGEAVLVGLVKDHGSVWVLSTLERVLVRLAGEASGPELGGARAALYVAASRLAATAEAVL